MSGATWKSLFCPGRCFSFCVWSSCTTECSSRQATAGKLSRSKEFLCSATGEQANSEHAEAGAALRDLRLPFPEDREGADLQARLRQGLQLRKSEKVRQPESSGAVHDDTQSICKWRSASSASLWAPTTSSLRAWASRMANTYSTSFHSGSCVQISFLHFKSLQDLQDECPIAAASGCKQGTASTEWRTSSTRSTPWAQTSSRSGCWMHLFSAPLFYSGKAWPGCCCGKVSNFLWPFKLSSPKGGFINKRPGLRRSQAVMAPEPPCDFSRPRLLRSPWWWLGQSRGLIVFSLVNICIDYLQIITGSCQIIIYFHL